MSEGCQQRPPKLPAMGYFLLALKDRPVGIDPSLIDPELVE
jgi:hypothetical protein